MSKYRLEFGQDIKLDYYEDSHFFSKIQTPPFADDIITKQYWHDDKCFTCFSKNFFIDISFKSSLELKYFLINQQWAGNIRDDYNKHISNNCKEIPTNDIYYTYNEKGLIKYAKSGEIELHKSTNWGEFLDNYLKTNHSTDYEFINKLFIKGDTPKPDKQKLLDVFNNKLNPSGKITYEILTQ